MDKLISFYATKKGFKIHAYSSDEFGIYHATLPALCIPYSESKQTTINSIAYVIDRSCEQIVPNKNQNGKVVLVALKEKTWSSLYKNKSCDLSINNRIAILYFREYSYETRKIEIMKKKEYSLELRPLTEIIEEAIFLLQK